MLHSISLLNCQDLQCLTIFKIRLQMKEKLVDLCTKTASNSCNLSCPLFRTREQTRLSSQQKSQAVLYLLTQKLLNISTIIVVKGKTEQLSGYIGWKVTQLGQKTRIQNKYRARKFQKLKPFSYQSCNSLCLKQQQN